MTPDFIYETDEPPSRRRRIRLNVYPLNRKESLIPPPTITFYRLGPIGDPPEAEPVIFRYVPR